MGAMDGIMMFRVSLTGNPEDVRGKMKELIK